MVVDVRFTDIHCVEDGTRKGLRIDVTARADGGGALDMRAMQELRRDVFELVQNGLPLCIKEKGGAK